MKEIKQVPSKPENWLYNSAQDYTRIFSKLVYRPESAPAWAECTNEKKEEWEREHPQPEPHEPENE